MATGTTPHRRFVALVSLGAYAAGLAGCARATVPPAGIAPVGAAVRVELDPPREVPVRVGARSELRLTRVTGLMGRVRLNRPDTVYLEVSSISGDGSAAEYRGARGGRAAVARGDGVTIIVLKRNAAGSEALIIGATVGGLALLIMMIASALGS